MRWLLTLLALIAASAFAQAPGLVLPGDPRFCGCPPARDADGSIHRSSKVLAEFQRAWPKPSIVLPGAEVWIMDHPVPLACGGCDAVQNLQWLPEHAWRDKSKWERKVYGGQKCSPGCP